MCRQTRSNEQKYTNEKHNKVSNYRNKKEKQKMKTIKFKPKAITTEEVCISTIFVKTAKQLSDKEQETLEKDFHY